MLVGIAFGAGWTPCLGSILGAILTHTAASADLKQGLPLLLAYSLGLALPFLLAAVAVERFLETVTRIRPYLARVSQLSGALLILVGVLMMLDYFTILANYMQGWTPEFLRSRLEEEQPPYTVRCTQVRRPNSNPQNSGPLLEGSLRLSPMYPSRSTVGPSPG